MPRTNDFPHTIKTTLARRAGYKCCYLSCGQGTIGPSREYNDTGISNTGFAAHIYSASFGKGARRVPPEEMTSEEIKSLQNGIWMCGTHGKYIDTDEIKFTAEQLRKWKQIGEEVALKMQEFNRTYPEAINEIVQADPSIKRMIVFAQKNDPNINRYHSLDLTLYKKLLKMIPESVRSAARNGLFINRHSSSLRDPMGRYLFDISDNPIELSFFDKEIQSKKEAMDYALYKLNDELVTNTFMDENYKGNEIYYYIPPEWQMTQEKRYFEVENKINVLSEKFIESFDSMHRLCREKFLE